MIRMKWTKRLTGLFLSVAVFTLFWLGTSLQAANAAEAVQPNLQLAVKSAILVEASTGKILYSNNPDIALPPASMTKMMTEYLVLEALKQKKITWDEKVPVSEYAFYIAKMSDSAGVYLNLGEEFTVQELYKAMAIASANDATVLLAEKVGGSEANFVAMMNKKAQELGMKTAFFATASGLPANELGPYSPKGIDKDNVMSARDAAILARALITDFPEALEYSKIPRLTFREGTENPLKKANYNWMLPGLPNEYAGVDGLKTGYTDQAKYCFTGTAIRDGIRLISVVMGTESETKRFVETQKLLDYGFSNFKLTKVQEKDSAIKGFETAPVKKGVELSVPAVAENDIQLVSKIGEEKNYQPTVTFNDLTAPIKKGQVIGQVVYQAKGITDEYLRPEDAQKSGYNLVAAQDVEEASWIRLLFRSIFEFISNMLGGK
ncbi:D-alanyl-D-alanine carboxypeptidase family protein [Brevibacillus fulvus]|uniref:serine-type D-Ala-D-Ala carboxypeptidase n=1 Tax=Brevibacillus fulvus TaxID=1125967 RepID=A0A939BQY6_9BACL|nr:D-alanyl-D-alanine carboxypeptidase family protein [Brevibacillus fulvus]MBM7592110.1 D-alanyl-D-alanine carboxypeptidase (penicillin-binding protein 5/6) [Brevibacillus fulvus]